jgi:hypothetical protein
MKKFQTNDTQKTAEVSIFISNKAEFILKLEETKKVIRIIKGNHPTGEYSICNHQTSVYQFHKTNTTGQKSTNKLQHKNSE